MNDRIERLQDEINKCKVDIELNKVERDDLTSVKIDLADVKAKLAGLQETTGRPFFKDSRFWAGLAAIPLLIAGGWTIDKLFEGKPMMLAALHRALGTQPVIRNAIETSEDPLRVALEVAFKKTISEKGLLAPAFEEQVQKRFNIVQTGLLQLGLTRPDRVRKTLCKEVSRPADAAPLPLEFGDHICEDLSEAVTTASTSVFGLRTYKNLDIDIGVYVAEIPRNAQGEFDLKGLKALAPAALNIGKILSVTIDDVDIVLPEPKVWIQSGIGTQTMHFAHVRIDGVKIQYPANDFPLHTFTIRLAPGAPENYLVSTAFIINVPKAAN